ncbi:SsrA-binding protein [Helicobacter monodelphidis]|uniref:SsrA-binding protein SmpB n=1 Tax=Helicobacter sp. 15-1451 TaxID=2004995 RepID=UPI000DCD96F8|nr:SsrA-binding protein SmpB [Helicobacter sp. 15-1451]RAX58122.1 SsrA-binding protein [Helicobacter sp. 15-1451]
MVENKLLAKNSKSNKQVNPKKKIVATNKKARFDYFILETLEVGIELKGSEVKALRAGRVNLKDSFVRVMRSELFLLNAHISFLETTYVHFKPNERRARKLLAHKKEIHKLLGETSTKGRTIVALSIYFNARNRAKVEIALAEGKDLHDKRETIKRRIADREARAELKRY